MNNFWNELFDNIFIQIKMCFSNNLYTKFDIFITTNFHSKIANKAITSLN